MEMQVLTQLAVTAGVSALSLGAALAASARMGRSAQRCAAGAAAGLSAAALALTPERPLPALTALVVFCAAAAALSVRRKKRPPVQGLVLLENGVIRRENLRRAGLDLDGLLNICAAAGWLELRHLRSAVLEPDGAVTLLPGQDAPCPPWTVQTPVVLEGRLVAENLRRTGKEAEWVRSRLADQGYRDEGDVLLALLDGGEELTVFPMDPARKSRKR